MKYVWILEYFSSYEGGSQLEAYSNEPWCGENLVRIKLNEIIKNKRKWKKQSIEKDEKTIIEHWYNKEDHIDIKIHRLLIITDIDVDEKLLESDKNPYCLKNVPGCYCKIGFPPEKQCPDCRSEEKRDSFCVCPPKD